MSIFRCRCIAHRRRAIVRSSGIIIGFMTLAAVPTVEAGTVGFANPQGTGHFDWGHPAGGQVIPLNITLPPESQPAPLGPGTFTLTISESEGTSAVAGGGGQGRVFTGGIGATTALALAYDAPIPTPQNTVSGTATIISPATGTNLVEGVPCYLGVRFNPGDGLHFGWIGVTRIGLDLDVFAWGYETVANTPIGAGVPEPGSLAMLACGAVALLARRRIG